MIENLKNVFEASNARDFTSNQLVNEFIWTDSFSEILYSTKNQIVLGSRGSGKTALVKMLSHHNLRKLACKNVDLLDRQERRKIEEANKIIQERKLIATYVPLKVEWVNSLENYKESKDKYFIWSLNLATCSRLIETAKSCIDAYVEDEIDAVLIQRSICKSLSKLWVLPRLVNNFIELIRDLETLEYEKNLMFNKESMGLELTTEEMSLGLAFHGNLFSPFTIATKKISEFLDIPNSCKWILCLDEAEFLSKEHHQILNTHMRSANDIFFKITTMPYRHHTLSTTVDANVNVGHDLEYVYIDKLGTINKNQKTSDKTIQTFATRLFINRLRQFDNDNVKTLEGLVGHSKLAQDTNELITDEELLVLIDNHCNEATNTRAKKLYRENKKKFDDEIGRKNRGILLLRDEYHNRIGSSNSSLYSGVAIISRCSDGNPRRLFRLFNHLLNGSGGELNLIAPTVQSKRIKSFSHSELEVIKFEKGGMSSFELIKSIGSYFKVKTLEEKLGSDLPQAISIQHSVDDRIWAAIKSAVDLGLLYPVVKKDSNERSLFPVKEGVFSLANCLAPHFNLFPRVGREVSISTVINSSRVLEQMELFENE